MNLHIEWGALVQLRDARRQNMIYALDLAKVPATPGVYIFARRWGQQFEALYVGRAGNIRNRAKNHLNSVSLMQHLRLAKSGKRFLLAGPIIRRPGQTVQRCLALAERALIRHFLSEGHDLVNKQGTRLRRHELESSGKHPKRFFPARIYLEKAKGE